jgi:hypothetical protein
MMTSLINADLSMEHLPSSHPRQSLAAPAPDAPPWRPERLPQAGTLTTEQLKDAVAQMLG